MAFSKFIFGETLEQALEAVPEDCQLRFYRMVKDYGLHGIEPDLTGFELATWVQMKAMIDITMPKKNNASPVSKVGAPFGNRNAQKITKNNSDNQNNSDNCNELFIKNNSENNQSNFLNENGNENVNENENGNVKKQPPLLFVKNKIKEHGFFLDDDRALERLIAGTDPPWFEGRNSFIDFIAQKVQTEYGDKPDGERHRLFRKFLFDAPNLREAYPDWRRQQERRDALNADEEALEAAWNSHPTRCEKCEVELACNGESFFCTVCGDSYTFSQESREWNYHVPPPEVPLSEKLKDISKLKQEEVISK